MYSSAHSNIVDYASLVYRKFQLLRLDYTAYSDAA